MRSPFAAISWCFITPSVCITECQNICQHAATIEDVPTCYLFDEKDARQSPDCGC